MDTVAFTLIASGVGMVIVFVFLTGLSLIMAGIRGVDRAVARTESEPSGRTGATRGRTAESLRDGAATQGYVSGHPAWVIAAVSAYLDSERSDAEHSAGVWTGRAVRG